MATHHAGQVLNERKKGAVLWQARISADRNRLEVIGVIEASTTAIDPCGSRPEADEKAQHFAELVERYGPFDSVTRRYALSVVMLWTTFRYATLAYEDAQRARLYGKGRRPRQSAINSLAKRQGLAWGDYDQALTTLERLAAKHGQAHPLTAVRRALTETSNV